MRWRFIDPANRAEIGDRSAVLALIDAWWCEFQGMTDQLAAHFSQKANWDLPQWMEEHLQGIDMRMMWEFGPPVKGSGHRLVITPEAAHHLRPLVRVILKRAPVVDGWEFYEYRLAEDLGQTLLTVEGRTGRDIADFRVKVSRGEQHRIDLVYTSPTIAGPEDQSAFDAAFVATETLLGE